MSAGKFDAFVRELDFTTSMQDAGVCADRARVALDAMGAQLKLSRELLVEAMALLNALMAGLAGDAESAAPDVEAKQ